MADALTEVHQAMQAVHRARAVSRGLDQSSRASDVLQVAAGIQVELVTIERHLFEAQLALSGLTEAVTGDRPGKERLDARATSVAAARAITLKSGTKRTQVLMRLWSRDQTDFELQRDLHMSPSTERPRRGELVDCGLVCPTGAVRMHEGTDWTVWGLTSRGVAAARMISNGQVLKLERMFNCAPEQVSTQDEETIPNTLF